MLDNESLAPTATHPAAAKFGLSSCCLSVLFAFIVFNFIHILLKCITLGFSGYKLNASTTNSRRESFNGLYDQVGAGKDVCGRRGRGDVWKGVW